MADMATTSFGELLRRHRQAAGLTQAELAERAGLSWRGLNDLERGVRRHPRRDTVALLAAALGLSAAARVSFEAAARGIAERQPAAQGDSSALPTGTVTFLFTDIEGSTHLLQLLGATRYAQALASTRGLLRAAYARHHGRVVDATGDSSFAVFATAPDALAAAAEAQRALASQAWPDGATVRVRMGLHTGTAEVVGDHYIGLDVHRAARIAAAGHGGQVLLSWATSALVEAELPETTTLRDLGAHRLKDLQRPEQLWLLTLTHDPGLPADFPPLRTLQAHPHNLPIQPTLLIGREREVAAVVALLRLDGVRLMTLTGLGGVGKTRLALQVAAELVDDFPDGVWFVRLSRLVDPALVIPTIAQTLGLRDAGRQPISATLASYLHDKRLLLLLDNFEQVAAAAPEVADLLQTSPHLTVLATSRVALHLRGEKQVQVRPLPLPDPAHLPPPQHLVQHAAVALFVQRAQNAGAAFALTNATALEIAAICARLDGLPLAIELAAARTRLLPPAQLLERLERSLPLLVGGARDLEARQQTMRATLAWSEDLLQPEEQRFFRRLAVFVGGFTLEAAEAVCAAPEGVEPLGVSVLEGLEQLVDQSLVQRLTVGQHGGEHEEADGEARFRLLYVVREYALERLDASEDAEALRQAHAAYYLHLAVMAEPHLWRSEQVAWLNLLERELDNIRAALRWAGERGALELGIRLAVALYKFWIVRGRYREGRSWLEGLLAQTPLAAERTGANLPAGVQATGLAMAGILAFILEDFSPAAAQLEAGLTLARQADDKLAAVFALVGLGELTRMQGDLERSAAHFEAALEPARELGDVKSIAFAHILQGLGGIANARGDWAQAAARFEEALGLFRELGSWDDMAYCLEYLGRVALRQGNLEQAEGRLREALGLFRGVGNQVFVARILERLAMTAAAAGQAVRAARLLWAQAVLRETMGVPIVPEERANIEAAVAPARAALGEERWAAAFAAGQPLSLEEAIAEALGDDARGAG